jgi:predicted nucleotidyltransferase
MHFHTYLERVFGSRAKMKLLEVFFTNSDTEFTGRELARRIDFTPSRVHSILKELVSENLVKMRRTGRSYLFSLNHDSFLAEKLKYIFSEEYSPIKRLQKIISSHLSEKNIYSTILFGSIARRKEDPDSDIDLFCIVSDKSDKEEIMKKLLKLNDLTLSLFGNSVSPTIFTTSELHKGFKRGEALIQELLRDGILLAGKPLLDIVTEVG